MDECYPISHGRAITSTLQQSLLLFVILFVMIVLILDKTDETALQMDTAIDLTQPVGDVSGYLMKEGNNLVKDWKRRWFVFTPLELRYYKKEGVRRVGHICI